MIAEFMEYPGDGTGRYFRPVSEALVSADKLPYHTSWDWLMPVVEKINTLFGGEMNTLIMSNACKIYSDNPSIYNSIVDANSTIEATYQAVCKFIEWYNENK